MTDETDARARLLAHYQDRLLTLAAKLEAAQAEVDDAQGRSPAVHLRSMVTRLQRDIVSTREKVRRLREAIGP